MQCMYWNMYNCKTKNIFWFNDQTLHKDCDLTIEKWDGGLGSGVIKKSAFCAFDFADYYIFMYIICVGCFFGQAFLGGIACLHVVCLNSCLFFSIRFLWMLGTTSSFEKGWIVIVPDSKTGRMIMDGSWCPPRYKWIIPSGKLTVRPWKSPFFGGN